jgi:hypothetical protein
VHPPGETVGDVNERMQRTRSSLFTRRDSGAACDMSSGNF